MALTLIVLTGDPETEQPLTLDGPRLFVGRADSCELRLPDPSVSQRHASFRLRGSDYLIVDEGSTNGTFVGPVRLAPQAPRVVRSGDLLRFGRIWVQVNVEAVPATTHSTLVTKELALKLVAQAMAAAGDNAVPRLRILQGPDLGGELVLEQPEKRYVLGRSTTSDLRLEEENASRRHVEVFVRNGQVVVRDLGSKNGTILAGRPIDSGQEILWSPESILEIGRDQIRLADPVGDALADLERAADEVMPGNEEVPLPSTAVNCRAIPEGARPTKALAQGSPGPRRPSEGPRQVAKGQRPSESVTKADLLVGLFAILVLIASALGLYWLMSGR